jgi:hypothetical protein
MRAVAAALLGISLLFGVAQRLIAEDAFYKGKMEVEYVPGEELQKLADTMLRQPPGVVKRVKKLLPVK